METLNERIKKLRLEKKITQSDLARLVGISDKAVSKWEVGDSSPDISLLPELAKIFNVTIDYLLTGEKKEDFSLKDLDDNKRLYYLIDKDDAENFAKFNYLSPNNKPNSVFDRYLQMLDQNKYIYSLNERVINYIFEKKAYKIFSKFCDKLLSLDYGYASHVITIEKVIDNFIKFVIDIDRVDVLQNLGVRYFSIKYKKKPRYDIFISDRNSFKNNPKELLINAHDRLGSSIDISTPFIREDTLRYFFTNKSKSPKCYSYITKIDFTAKEGNKEGFTKYQILDEVLMIGIENNDFEFVKNSLDFIYAQNKISYDKIANYKSYDGYTSESLNFIHSKTYDVSRIICRLEFISKEIIDNLLYKGKYDLAVLAAKINTEVAANTKKYNFYFHNDAIYIPKETEIQQIMKIADPKSKSDLRLLKVLNGRFLMIDELLKTEDDKFICDCLKKYPTNSEELLKQYFSSNDLKGLYELMCDAGLVPSVELLDGNLTEKVKDDIYNLIVKKGRFSEIDSKNAKFNKDEILKKYLSRLELNKFYSNEESNIDKFISKIKNKDYLSLSVELVSIMERKLTAFGYTGEDFHEKLTKYLDRKFPTDEESYETPEICNLLQRLRIMRNSYLHPTINENVKPLTDAELTKCVKYILKEMEK